MTSSSRGAPAQKSLNYTQIERSLKLEELKPAHSQLPPAWKAEPSNRLHQHLEPHPAHGFGFHSQSTAWWWNVLLKINVHKSEFDEQGVSERTIPRRIVSLRARGNILDSLRKVWYGSSACTMLVWKTMLKTNMCM